MSKLNSTKYSAMVANAASKIKVSSTIFKDFIADIYSVINGNDDLRLAHESETASDNVHGLGFKGALLKLTANQSIPTATATVISWGGVTYDTSSFWSAVNPSRLTIPNGVTKVRLKGMASWGSITDDTPRYISFRKGGTGGFPGNAQLYHRNIGTFGYRVGRGGIESAVLDVVAGNYFEMVVQQDSAGALDFTVDSFAWFALEVVQ